MNKKNFTRKFISRFISIIFSINGSCSIYAFELENEKPKTSSVVNLNEIKEDAKNIDAIVISHTHDDHVSALRVFLKSYHPKVYVTEKDEDYVPEYKPDKPTNPDYNGNYNYLKKDKALLYGYSHYKEDEIFCIIMKTITGPKNRTETIYCLNPHPDVPGWTIIGDDFIPSIVDEELIDEIITIDDEDAINMSRILAKNFGLGVGISSGANLLASILTAKDNDNVVTVFADDFKKYLTTDLIKEINNNSNLISNQIEILSIEGNFIQ